MTKTEPILQALVTSSPSLQSRIKSIRRRLTRQRIRRCAPFSTSRRRRRARLALVRQLLADEARDDLDVIRAPMIEAVRVRWLEAVFRTPVEARAKDDVCVCAGAEVEGRG